MLTAIQVTPPSPSVTKCATVQLAATGTKLVALLRIPATVTEAWISAMPSRIPVTRPVSETDATGDPIQAADDVKSSVVPSEKVPVAVSCTVAPTATQGLTGVIVSEPESRA